MTQKATHDPKQKGKHLQPTLTQNIYKKKVMFPSSKRKKSWVSRMHVATSHWLTKILILKFFGPHFCPILMPWVLIGVYSSVGQILKFGQVSTKARIQVWGVMTIGSQLMKNFNILQLGGPFLSHTLVVSILMQNLVF